MKAAWPLVLAAGVVSSPAMAEMQHGGHGHGGMFSTGEPGDAKKPARIVQVTMTEANGKMLFSPSRVEIQKGEQIRFMLRNGGELDHEFILATSGENLQHAEAMKKNPDMAHAEPNGRKLGPKKTSEMVWKFSKSGEFEYACLLPGHREAGMIGTVVVR